MTFDEILNAILVPRENGSAALGQVAAYLETAARASGAQVSLHEFVCRPYAIRLLGVVSLALAIAIYACLCARRPGWALLLALALPLYLTAENEARFPLLSRIGEMREHNVLVRFPVAQPARIVVLGAHYDTKTDLLDHYQRAPIQFLILPMLGITLVFPLTALWRHWRGKPKGRVRLWAAVVPLYFAAFFLSTTGGAFVSARSPGALDDGAAVATLLKLAEALGAGAPKLERTQIDIVFFAGEEVGLQGSAHFVGERFGGDPTAPGASGGHAQTPTYFINIEGWGFGPELSYFTTDRSATHRYPAAPGLVRVLDRAYRRVSGGTGLAPETFPAITDARNFMAVGIPSVTLASRDGDARVRGLHTAADSRDRIQPGTLDHGLRFLQVALAEIDARGVE